MTDTTLATLVAQNAIRRLISGYCDTVSRRDADAAGALYARDARVQIHDGAERVGREAIVEGLRRSIETYSFLHQKCDTGLIDVEGKRAWARLSVFEVNRRFGADSLGTIFGIYDDEYVLLDAGWRFQRRRFTLQLRAVVAASEIQQFPEIVPSAPVGDSQ